MIRSYRICGMAAIDLFLTLVAAALMSKWLSLNVFLSFIILFFVGQLFHIAFGVETAFVKWASNLI